MDTERDVTRRPRRRGEEVERAILQAAATEIEEHGYDGFTMDRVAARAGTNKTVIYRRWPSRTALAFAAYRQLVARPEVLPDAGDLRTDVVRLLRSVADRMASPAGVDILQALMVDARRQPELQSGLRQELVDGELGLMLTLLARAVSRGEARPESLVVRIATVPIALLRAECVMCTPSHVSDEAIAEIVDLVFLPLVRVS